MSTCIYILLHTISKNIKCYLRTFTSTNVPGAETILNQAMSVCDVLPNCNCNSHAGTMVANFTLLCFLLAFMYKF